MKAQHRNMLELALTYELLWGIAYDKREWSKKAFNEIAGEIFKFPEMSDGELLDYAESVAYDPHEDALLEISMIMKFMPLETLREFRAHLGKRHELDVLVKVIKFS